MRVSSERTGTLSRRLSEYASEYFLAVMEERMPIRADWPPSLELEGPCLGFCTVGGWGGLLGKKFLASYLLLIIYY